MRTLHYGQDKLLFDTQRTDHLVLAGVGYGKSNFGVVWLEKRRRDNPRSKEFLIVAPTHKLLKLICFEKYIEFLASLGLKQGYRSDYSYNKSIPLIQFRNGQKIIGITAENPAGIVGYTSAAVWIDEAALCDAEVRRKVLQRNRCPDANYLQVLHTTTPEGLNWLYDTFNAPDLVEDGVISSNASKLILSGSSYDNPYLPEQFLRNLEEDFSWDEKYFQNYVLGKFTNLSRNTFYFNFNQLEHVKKVELDYTVKQVFLTFDFNVGQMSWALMQRINGGYHVIEENGSNGRNIDDACIQFVDKFKGVLDDFTISIEGDAVGHHRSTHSYTTGYEIIERVLRPHFKNLIVNAQHGNPLVEERSRITNKLLAANRLVIHPRCRKTIESLKKSETKTSGSGIKKGSTDTVTHAMEAVDMALVRLEPAHARTARIINYI